jgi:quinol monooxygenase YgiN
MRHLLFLLVTITLTATQAPVDPSFYAISYVELMPSARAAGVAALKQYRDSSSKDEGYARIEFFEQIGWPGHIVVVERWMDQRTFDAHGKAPHTADFLSRLQPIRVSGYDQRPYKTLAVSPPAGSATNQAVYVVSHVDIGGGGPQGDAPGLLRRLAEASRKEGGNLRFDILQHNVRANHFTVVEGWRSQKDLDAHAAAAHTRQYRDVLQPMTGSPLDERIYTAVE